MGYGYINLHLPKSSQVLDINPIIFRKIIYQAISL